jgi:hypothetical protein
MTTHAPAPLSSAYGPLYLLYLQRGTCDISKTRFLAIDIHKFYRILIDVIVSTDTTESDRIAQHCTDRIGWDS